MIISGKVRMPATSNREDRVYESAYGSLRQILDTHIAVEIGIFSIEIGSIFLIRRLRS